MTIDSECPICQAKGRFRKVAIIHGEGKPSDLFHCHECGLVFVYPVPAVQEHFHHEFSSLESQSWETQDWVMERRRNYYNHLFSVLKDQLIPPARLLDFGCGFGQFLACASRIGFESTGVDISPACRQYIGTKFPGIKTYATTDSLVKEKQTFDVITSLDCLYYVTDPVKELQKLRELQKPGGKMLLMYSGNRAWVIWLLSILKRKPLEFHPGNRVARFCFNNLAYYGFTTKSTRILMKRLGMVNVKAFHMPGPVALSPKAKLILRAWRGMASVIRFLTFGRIDLDTKIHMIGTLSS